jgi:hypothetical protein
VGIPASAILIDKTFILDLFNKNGYNNYNDKIRRLQMRLSPDYKNYGKPVVSNIRNRTTNINTIKLHKENKREGIKSDMQ